MKNIVCLFAIVAVLGVGAIVEAQPPNKVYRIGYLVGGSGIEASHERTRQGLRELGYIEGQNMVIEWRFAKGNADRLPALAAELVQLKLDVIVAAGTEPIRALKNATTTIPIVVTVAGDLVGRGLVASLARPGGNITGSTMINPGLSGKRMELIKDVIPHASRVAFLYQPHEQDELRELQNAARALEVHIQPLEVQQASQFQNAYAAMTKERPDALSISRNPFTNVHRRQLVDLAVKYRLPAMCEGRDWTNDCCLMSYLPDRTEAYRRAAVYVDKILKGANPATLPVEQPTKFELVINLKTARRLAVRIPADVLIRADRVIK